MQGEDVMNDKDGMQECPNCHLRRVSEKKLVYEVKKKTYRYVTVVGKPPKKKLNVYGTLIGSGFLFVIMLKLIAQSFPYNPN